MNLDEVRWVAQLARLEFDGDELQTVGRKLSNILEYVEQIQDVDTSDVEPLAHPLPIVNAFREDVAAPSLDPNTALANAPDREANFFGVPAVFE